MLSERENALRTLKMAGEPKWVPLANECYNVIVPSAIWERPKGGAGEDWFGCWWEYDAATNGYAQPPRIPPICSDVALWREQVNFPDLDKIDWDGCASRDLERFDRGKQLLQLFWESGPFERLHHLLGFENAFISMYEEPESVKELMGAITDFRIEAMKRAMRAYKPDIINTHDDIGTAKAPMMSMEMYREFVKPCHIRLFKVIHEGGVMVLQHSCGKMEAFLEDMIECGADIINPVQSVNSQADVARRCAGKAAISGGFTTRLNYSDITEEEIRSEVRKIIDIFAPYKNFVLEPFSVVPIVTPVAIDEAKKYGFRYWDRP